MYSQSQEIEKDYAECILDPDGEQFPAISINESSNSPTTEVPCLMIEGGLIQPFLTEIHGDPPYGEEACIMEEVPLR